MQTPATVSSEVTKELDAVIHLQSGKNRYLMASKNFAFLSWINFLNQFTLYVVVRRWFVRKQLKNSVELKKQSHNEKKKTRRKSRRKVSEVKVIFFFAWCMLLLCVSKLSKLYYLSCLGSSFRAVSSPTLGSSWSPEPGSESRNSYNAEGRWKHCIEGGVATVWGKMDKARNKNEVNGGNMAKTYLFNAGKSG